MWFFHVVLCGSAIVTIFLCPFCESRRILGDSDPGHRLFWPLALGLPSSAARRHTSSIHTSIFQEIINGLLIYLLI